MFCIDQWISFYPSSLLILAFYYSMFLMQVCFYILDPDPPGKSINRELYDVEISCFQMTFRGKNTNLVMNE